MIDGLMDERKERKWGKRAADGVAEMIRVRLYFRFKVDG